MTAAWFPLLLALLLPSAARSVARLPRVTFLAPQEMATLPLGEPVSIELLVENGNRSRTLLQVDGEREVWVEDCHLGDPCTATVVIENMAPGGHSVALVMLGHEGGEGHLTSSTLRFRLGGDAARPPQYLEPPTPVWLSPPSTVEAKAEPRITVVVLSYNRGADLQVLLDSLRRAHYDGAAVDLVVWLDAPRDASDHANVARVREARRVADAFAWPHGRKRLHLRARNANIVVGWLEAWYPEHDDDAALIVEDDIEVSPLWFRWARAALAAYSDADAESVYGMCLQQQWLSPGAYMHELRARNGNQPFLFPVFGTWAPVVRGRWWREFVWWFELKQTQPEGTYTLDIPETWTNRWVRWSNWFDRFAFEYGAYCLYPNLPTATALVVNHKAPGIHYTERMKDDCTLASDADAAWLGRYLAALPPARELDVLWYDGSYVPAFRRPEPVILPHDSGEPLAACRDFSPEAVALVADALHAADDVLEVGASALRGALQGRVRSWRVLAASAEVCAAVGSGPGADCAHVSPGFPAEEGVAQLLAARRATVVIVHLSGCGFPDPIDLDALLDAVAPAADPATSLFLLGTEPAQVEELRNAGWERGWDVVARVRTGGLADARWQRRTERRGIPACETVYVRPDGVEVARVAFLEGGAIADMR